MLIAIDGSPSSLNALRHAIRLTEGKQGPHHFGLLNVHTPTAVPFDIGGLSHSMINDYLERIGTEELAAAQELAQATPRPCTYIWGDSMTFRNRCEAASPQSQSNSL